MSLRGLGRFERGGDDARGRRYHAVLGRGRRWLADDDLFENIYIRSVVAEMYDELARHELPATDQSVKDARAIMAEVVGDFENLRGQEGALETDMPTSVGKVFNDCRKPRRRSSATSSGSDHDDARARDGLNVFTFR